MVVQTLLQSVLAGFCGFRAPSHSNCIFIFIIVIFTMVVPCC